LSDLRAITTQAAPAVGCILVAVGCLVGVEAGWYDKAA
jgi:hypothetical protein